MRTTRWLPSSFLALALLLGAPARAGETDSALDAFTRAYTEIEGLVHAPTQPKPEVIQTKVDALLDYHSITIVALGGPSRWEQRCAERCAEVESLLGEIIRHNYLAKLASRPQGEVEILRQHVRAKASKVDTLVRYLDKDGTPKRISVAPPFVTAVCARPCWKRGMPIPRAVWSLRYILATRSCR